MGLFDHIPERALEPPVDHTPLCCCHCKQEFMPGDKVYWDGKEPYCFDCFIDWAYDFLETSPEEMGERLGFEVEPYEE